MRFPEFDGEWKTKKLIELSENGFSNGAFNDPKKVGSGYRIINVKDMYVDTVINVDKLTRVNIDESEFFKNRVEYGDIFFTRSSLVKEGIAYSNVNLSNVADLTFDGHLIRMRPNKIKYCPLFLYYNFLTSKIRKQLILRGKTTTMTTIGQEDIASVKVIFPSISEQGKISSFLTLIDNRIQTQIKIIKELEVSIQIFREQLFSQKIRFSDYNGNAFPDWKEITLNEVAQKRIVKNKNLKVKLVLTNSASQGIINQRDFFDKDIANKNNIGGYYVVEKEDFVYNPRISNEAPVGPISRNKIDTGVMSPLYMVFRFNEINLDFIEQFYKTKIWHQHMENISNFGARADRMSFISNDFFKMPLLLPNSLEQKKIADFLTSYTNKIDLEKQILLKYQSQRIHFLQNLFI